MFGTTLPHGALKVIQRLWLFALGFYWIEVKGHSVICGVWRGDSPKVVVANHTGFLDMVRSAEGGRLRPYVLPALTPAFSFFLSCGRAGGRAGGWTMAS